MTRKLFTAVALCAALAAALVGVSVAPAGATMIYVNEMPLNNGDVLKCFRSDTLVQDGAGNWLRQYTCSRYQHDTGAYLGNDLNLWAPPNPCDLLVMHWDPNGADWTEIYNSQPSGEALPGETASPGCGAGDRNNGSTGMAYAHEDAGWAFGVGSVKIGGLFVVAAVNTGTWIRTGGSLTNPTDYAFKATWT